MSMLLLQAPPAQLTSPGLALAKLVGWLRSKGVEDIAQADLNLRCFNHFLHNRYRVLDRAKRALDGHHSAPDIIRDRTTDEQRARITKVYVQWADANLDRLPSLVGQLRPGDSSGPLDELEGPLEALSRWSVVLDVAYGYRWSWRSFPYSARCLGAVDALCRWIDGPHREYFDWELSEGALTVEHDFVGISVSYAQQLGPGLLLAHTIKSRRPDSTVVLGGAYPSLLLHQLRQVPRLFDFVDAIVIGEGEQPLLRLLEGQKRSDIPNLLYREGGEVLGKYDMHAFKYEHAVPDFSDLPLAEYLSPKIILPVAMTSNCYYAKCSFCSHILGRSGYTSIGARQVVETLRELTRAYGAVNFYFCDNALPPGGVRSLTRELLAADFACNWYGDMIVSPSLSLDDLCRARAAGLIMAYVGFETFEERLLKLLGKPQTVDEALAFWNRLHAAGIGVKVNVILGLPGETKQETERVLDRVRAGCAAADRLDIVVGLAVEPGTPVAEAPSLYGIQLGSPNVASESLELEIPHTHATAHNRQWVAAAAERLQQEVRDLSAAVMHPACKHGVDRDYFALIVAEADESAFVPPPRTRTSLA